jgi:hypothetical protein
MEDIIFAREIPSGWKIVVLGDGARACTRALTLSAIYPGCIYFIGSYPSIFERLFDRRGIERIRLPKDSDKYICVPMALYEFAHAHKDDTLFLLTVSELSNDIVTENKEHIEVFYLTDKEMLLKRSRRFYENIKDHPNNR